MHSWSVYSIMVINSIFIFYCCSPNIFDWPSQKYHNAFPSLGLWNACLHLETIISLNLSYEGTLECLFFNFEIMRYSFNSAFQSNVECPNCSHLFILLYKIFCWIKFFWLVKKYYSLRMVQQDLLILLKFCKIFNLKLN